MFTEELRNVRLLSHLSDEALEDLSGRLRVYRYRKGNVVMQEGEIGRSMYIIRSGQVQIISESQGGEPGAVIAQFGPGEPVGELALLLGKRRSATVRATIDSELWELRKSDLDELLNKYPSLGLAFSRQLAIRLIDWHEPPKPESTQLIAVLGQSVLQLAWHLYQMTGDRILLLNLGQMTPIAPNILGYVTVEQIDINAQPGVLLNRLSEVLGHYDRVLMAVPRELNPLAHKAVEQAQVIIELDQESTLWVRRSAKEDKYWHYPNEDEAIAQVARRIIGKRIGLALSSGYARSIAHMGVLYALELADIPIDMLMGCNCGALFGGLWALGESLERISHLAQEIGTLYSWGSISGFNILPRMGFVRTNRVNKVLNRAFGDATFSNTQMPFGLLVADMMTGEEVILESGRMVDAMRASISSAPLFEPVQIGEQWLIDGAAINPLPSSALQDHVEIRMGSSVIMSRQERIRRQGTMPKASLLNFMNIFSNKEALMEAGMIEHALGDLDVLIEPDVGLFNAFNFERVDELIEAGIRATEPLIPSIRRLLYPPLRKRLPKPVLSS